MEKGDKLTVDAGGFKFNPIVLVCGSYSIPRERKARSSRILSRDLVNTLDQENSAEEFRWVGSLPWIFTGEHFFRFEASTKTPGGTTLKQGETFTGALSFLVGPTWSFGKKTVDQFESFNESLKKRAES